MAETANVAKLPEQMGAEKFVNRQMCDGGQSFRVRRLRPQ